MSKTSKVVLTAQKKQDTHYRAQSRCQISDYRCLLPDSYPKTFRLSHASFGFGDLRRSANRKTGPNSLAESGCYMKSFPQDSRLCYPRIDHSY